MGKVSWELYECLISLWTEEDHLAGLIGADNECASQLRKKLGKGRGKGAAEGGRRICHDRGAVWLEICILEVLYIAVLISYKGVKIAIIIDINKSGSRVSDYGCESEWNGYGRREGRGCAGAGIQQKSISPVFNPIKASRSPSASISTNLGTG